MRLQELDHEAEVMVLIDVVMGSNMCIMGQDNSVVHDLVVTNLEEVTTEAAISIDEKVVISSSNQQSSSFQHQFVET